MGNKQPNIHPTVQYSHLSVDMLKHKQFTELIESHRKTLDQQQSDDDLTRLLLYNSMAISYNAKCEYNLAVQYYNKCLQIHQQIFGSHASVSTIYNNMGNVYFRKKNYGQSLDCYRSALSQLLINPQTESAFLAVVYNNIGLSLAANTQWNSALDHYEASLQLKRSVYKDTTTEEAIQSLTTTYCNMGDAYYALCRYEKAVQLYNKCLQLNPISPFAITVHSNLANAYEQQNQYLPTLQHYEKAIELSKRLNLEQSLDLALVFQNLGCMYEGYEEYASAAGAYAQGYQIRYNKLGPKSRLTIKIELDMQRCNAMYGLFPDDG